MGSPNYKELIGIILIGILQPLTEIVFGAQLSSYYNFVAAAFVLGYVVYRLITQPSFFKLWGLRFDTFWASVPVYTWFTVVSCVVIYAGGYYLGHTPLPITFWYLLALYPIWGIAQQFALQNLVARNLTRIAPHVYMRALISGVVFSLAHTPSYLLMGLAAVAGFCFTILYDRKPNLLVLGISHGILGALIFYLILGQNQWEILRIYLGT